MDLISEKFKQELSDHIEKIIVEKELSVAKENVKEIVDTIMPQIDILIAKKIKAHMNAIATFILGMSE